MSWDALLLRCFVWGLSIFWRCLVQRRRAHITKKQGQDKLWQLYALDRGCSELRCEIAESARSDRQELAQALAVFQDALVNKRARPAGPKTRRLILHSSHAAAKHSILDQPAVVA